MATKETFVKTFSNIEIAVVDMIQSATFGIASGMFITKNVVGGRLSGLAKVSIARAAFVAYREAGLADGEAFERVFAREAARAMKADLTNDADVAALHLACGMLRHGVQEIINKFGAKSFEVEVIATFP